MKHEDVPNTSRAVLVNLVERSEETLAVG